MEDILMKIEEADMVLVGLGEEFDQTSQLSASNDYTKCRTQIEKSDMGWMVPALNHIYLGQDSNVIHALNKLAKVLEDKNYFVVSTSINDDIRDILWREGRFVAPCGGSRYKQCPDRCLEGLQEVTTDDWEKMKAYSSVLLQKKCLTEENSFLLGKCPKCGKNLVLNSIYTESYDEAGYLDQWSVYTKWLQGTLNRKLLLLELGVGLQCPSVIRWPFEKIAFYNQKAYFCRVNESLYQISADLKGKGVGISKSAVDWLENLC